MSYITALSENAQNIVMLNFEFFGKKVLLATALIWAIFYCFYFRPRQKETHFLLVAYIRTALYFTSYIFLWISPLTIFFLYPQVRLDVVLRLLISFYFVGFFVVGITILLNVFYLAPVMLVKFGGIDIDKNRTDTILKSMVGKKAYGWLRGIIPDHLKRFKNG